MRPARDSDASRGNQQTRSTTSSYSPTPASAMERCRLELRPQASPAAGGFGLRPIRRRPGVQANEVRLVLSELCTRTGLSRDAANRATATLKDLGWLAVVKASGGRRPVRYRVMIPAVERGGISTPDVPLNSTWQRLFDRPQQYARRRQQYGSRHQQSVSRTQIFTRISTRSWGRSTTEILYQTSRRVGQSLRTLRRA